MDVFVVVEKIEDKVMQQGIFFVFLKVSDIIGLCGVFEVLF